MSEESMTLAAIERVGKDVRDLRQEITGRLEQVVTRREHDAEVRRIDAEALRTKQDLASHEAQADARITAMEERRRQDRRYVATWTVAAVGVAVALAQLLTHWIGG